MSKSHRILLHRRIRASASSWGLYESPWGTLTTRADHAMRVAATSSFARLPPSPTHPEAISAILRSSLETLQDVLARPNGGIPGWVLRGDTVG